MAGAWGVRTIALPECDGARLALPSDQTRGEQLIGVGDANVAKAIGRVRLAGPSRSKMGSPPWPRPG
jgi:hypothetical protein